MTARARGEIVRWIAGNGPNDQGRRQAGDPVAREREQAARRGGLKALGNAAFDLLATFGAFSKDEDTRRTSDTYLALDARNRMEENQVRQTAALEGLAAGSRQVDDPSGQMGEGLQLLTSLETRSQAAPPPNRLAIYRGFVGSLRLSSRAATFGIGTCHIGWAACGAEREMASSSPADLLGVERTVSAVHAGAAGVEPVEVLLESAKRVTDDSTASGGQAVDEIPGPLRDDRERLREVSLQLLTTPTSEFQARPEGIETAQIIHLWGYGYALGCVSSCAPALAASAGILDTDATRNAAPNR